MIIPANSLIKKKVSPKFEAWTYILNQWLKNANEQGKTSILIPFPPEVVEELNEELIKSGYQVSEEHNQFRVSWEAT